MKTIYPVDRAKATLKYKILRFIWVKAGAVSKWAGKEIIKMLNKADMENRS